MRTDFKDILIDNKHYLYPIPVKSGEKYLIVIDAEFLQTFQEGIKDDLIISPDLKPEYLIFTKVHSDGKTPIYKIDFDKIYIRS